MAGQGSRTKFTLVLIGLAITVAGAVSARELPIEIGDSRATVISKLGTPEDTKMFRTTERLFYRGLMVDIRDDRAAIIRGTQAYPGTMFSLRPGDHPNRVLRILGPPDETDGGLIYYNHEGNYLNLRLNRERDRVTGFTISRGTDRETTEKRKKILETMAEEGKIPASEERLENLQRVASHERVTEREYKKRRFRDRELAREYHTITGRLTEKKSRLTPVEESHNLDGRMVKFVVEYQAVSNDRVVRTRQPCFIERSQLSLFHKLDALAAGDLIKVRGRWKNIETKTQQEKQDAIIDQRMSMNIFVVDRIE